MTRLVVRLSSLLKAAGVKPLEATGSDPEISDVTLDSRRVGPGALFCALPGLKSDGVSFVPEALRRGARAVVAESARPDEVHPDVAWVRVGHGRVAAALLAREWHGRPDEALTLVGVTGTNGKTSVVYLIEAAASAAGRVAGRIGTVSYAYGGREWTAERTTPEAPDLYRLLAGMRGEDVEIAAMEVSSHALEMRRVEGARFKVAAFLNLGRDHLDYHGTLEAYFAAKARLIEGLDRDAVAVLHADDPRIATVADRTAAKVVTFGHSEWASFRIASEQCRLDGTEVVLETPEGSLAVRTPLTGRFTPDNLAAAAACCLGAGLAAQALAEGAERLERIPGRMEAIDAGQPFAVFVDYAHTEQALERLLASVREMVERRVAVVFGCGGDRDRGKRAAMGRVAARSADLVFLTSDNPRGEDPMAILAQIDEGVVSIPGGEAKRRLVPDRAEAIGEAIAQAESGDAVVVAGKGHETMQAFADRVVRLDDREVAREALAAAGWKGPCRAGA